MSFSHDNLSIDLLAVGQHHPMRSQVEMYVKQRYQLAFDARLEQFMPVFLVLMRGTTILSVCGYRSAEQEPLFLEQYLDHCAEEMAKQYLGCSVCRSELIEFGQLAAFSKGMSPYHFLVMTRYLVEQGYRWCIFTATDPLFAMMRRLGLAPVVMVDADANRIANATQIWGSYYQNQPRIMAGDLVASLAHLENVLDSGVYKVGLAL